MEDELWTNDPLLQIFMGADWKLHGIFGDTINHNEGPHRNGEIGEDKDRKWQRLQEPVVAACLPLHSLPMVGGLSNFLLCKLLSGATSDCGDAIQTPLSLRE
jgi:hypothetical protein